MSLVGRLEDLALPDIIQIIYLSKKTGVLDLRSDKGTGMVAFKDGRVIQSASSRIRDTFGNMLVQQGLLSESALAAALAIQKRETDKPLGMILVEMGSVSCETIEDLVTRQIEESVFELLDWEEGFFNFKLGEIDPRYKIEIDPQEFPLKCGLNAEYLLMEGMRILDERRRAKPDPESQPPAVSNTALQVPLPSPVSSPTVREEFRIQLETEVSRKDLATLSSMSYELRFPMATSEVTLLILRYASEVVNRVVLFLVKKGEVCGLGQCGIELEGKSADQAIRTIKIPLNKPSLFLSVIESRVSFLGPIESVECNMHLVAELGGVMPSSAMAIPLIVDENIFMIVYGDNLPKNEPIVGINLLEIFICQAGLALEKALREEKIAELQNELIPRC